MEPKTNERQPTIVDSGWRREDILDASKATIFDEGWRNRVNNNLDPENIENKAASNYFPTISQFKEAVLQLPQLKSEKKTYLVKNKLSDEGGESVVLLCSATDEKEVAAKVYYEPINSENSFLSSRSKVLEYMSTEDGQKYTLAILDAGVLEFGSSKYYFEITPYIDDGDISDDGEFSFEEICNVTKQLNEAINSIHKFGLLHRDIKPSNIFKIDGRYVLGDFGVAKNVGEVKSDFTRHVVGTDGYIAPELRLSLTTNPTFIYNDKSDYYSLGVTLGSLFEGHFVYDNATDEMKLYYVQNSILPLKRDDSKRGLLENLLFHGLVNFDSTNRFGYEDVNKWLENHDYTGNNVKNDLWPRAFRMFGKEYNDEQSLFNGIVQNEETWNEAKALLYTKTFEQFFKSFRTDLSREAQKIEEQYRNVDDDKGLAIFLKYLFPQGHIVWKGLNFYSLEDLGNAIIDSTNMETYVELFHNNIISHWLSYTDGVETVENTKRLVNDIEKMALQASNLACYWFGFSFAIKEKKVLKILNKSISTYNELIETIFSSPNVFYDEVIDEMLNRSKGADFYGFLYYFGYKDIIDTCWDNIKLKNDFEKLCILFSMMDSIAEKEKANTKIIREFFVKYGPIGFATYTKKLVEQNVYIASNSNGKNIISRIQNFKEPSQGCVEELFKVYNPLLSDIVILTENLFDNPLCISAGIYGDKAIVCTNLAGCFAYDFFGKKAPVGFKAYITNSKDVKASIFKTNKIIPKAQKRIKIRFVNLLVFLLSLAVCGGIGFSIYQINPSFVLSSISAVSSKEAEPEIKYKEYYVLSDALNIRSEPNAESEIVLTVVKNTKLMGLDSDETSNWVHVKFEEKSGYVNKKYLDTAEEETK